MLKIDETIIGICENISSNIDKLGDDSGLLSQNILSQLRNLVEAIISKIYIIEKLLGDVDSDYNRTITPGIKYIKGISKYKLFADFHNALSISVSHYTLDDNNSERLIYKYLEYLIKTRSFLKTEFTICVLDNLADFPLNKNRDLYDYYLLISEKIELSSVGVKDADFDDRYYIHKKKPFFINGSIYYEITVVEARDKYSKFDRFVFYTKRDINPHYAIKIIIRRDRVMCNGLNIPIIIVSDYQVAIRPCEIDNYAKILGIKTKTNTTNKDYYFLTEYLKNTNYSLVDLIMFENNIFEMFIKEIESSARSKSISNILIQSRRIIANNLRGMNILKYLLLNLNNVTIKNQSYSGKTLVLPNQNLSNLHLRNGCIPFEEMPFCTSPIKTNVSLSDLFKFMDHSDREYELLARFLKNKAEKEKQIYTDVTELEQFNNVNELINNHNSKLFRYHQHRKIQIYKDKVFISNYDINVSSILSKIIELGKTGLENYTNSVISWQEELQYEIDSEEKQKALLNAFSKSKVFAIYGAAGTGKTKMLEHFSMFFHKHKKIFLSNTHASLENLKKRIKTDKSSFYSVKKFLCGMDKTCDVLIIDECSTISNEDMNDILTKSHFKVLILAGDPFQIESITFGNWFEILEKFITKESYIHLEKPRRTENQDLINLWDKVRKYDANIQEHLAKGKYCFPIDKNILETAAPNEIILCLNYDGLYGINNVNRLLQQRNTNESHFIGVNEYKIGDPILFNENSEKYEPLLFNNAKGTIHNIIKNKDIHKFHIELDKSINELDLVEGISLVGLSQNNNSIIEITVGKKVSSDNDNAESDIPFNITYAVSIHKSQGLEYDSVKIIIVDEVEENITHNIFYTAITRTKNTLKIFWSPNTQQNILSTFMGKNNNRDASIISAKHGLKIIE